MRSPAGLESAVLINAVLFRTTAPAITVGGMPTVKVNDITM
jgi:hypothetical protein